MLVRDNKYIQQEDRDFFILLRIGLWQRVEEELSPSPDWAYIYRLSCEQTVQGIVADGIGLYKTKYRCNIPTDINEQFLSAVAQIVRRNHQINKKQAEINSLFDRQSIRYYVVKGQEAAKNYPKPMLRCSGDIDYAIRIADFMSAQSMLMPLASFVHPYEEDKQDQSFEIYGVTVELHGNLHPSLGSRIDRAIDTLYDELFQGTTSYETFTTVYTFLHCLQHYHWTGLGIRQISDFAMLLAYSHERIDFARVNAAIIQEMRLPYEWKVFIRFCTDYLGMVPWYATKEQLEPIRQNKTLQSLSLWLACKSTGNFGHNHKTVHHTNFLIRNFIGVIGIFREYFRTRKVSPNLCQTLIGLRFNEYKKQLKRL